MTPTPEFVELAGARARIRELETAISEWHETLPDPGDVHHAHTRGIYLNECPSCMAEVRLILLAERLLDTATADKESTDN